MSSMIPLAVIALQGLAARRLRTALSCLSLILAVLALVAVEAASSVAQSAVLAQTVLLEGKPATYGIQLEPSMQLLQRSEQAAVSLRDRLGSSSVVRVAQTTGLAPAGGDGGGILVTAFQGPLLDVRPYPILSGVWPSASDALVPNVVVNRAASQFLTPGSESVPVNLSPAAGVVAVRVVGVIENGDDQPQVYLQLTDAEEWDTTIGELWETTILVHVPQEAVSRAPSQIGTATALAGLGSSEVRRLDQFAAFQETLDTVRLTFVLVAVLGMTVGMLGILNIGLATLGERVEELALRRATGATRGQIAAIVLLEALFTALFAAIVAIVLARITFPWTAYVMFPNLPDVVDFDFPYLAALVGILASAAAGILGGALPAIRAARISIATVMRA